MGAWALNPNSRGLVMGVKTMRACEDEGINGFGFGSRRVSELRVRRFSFGYRSLVVTAAGKKKNHDNPSSSGNNDPPVPERDSPEGINPAYDKSKSEDSTKSHLLLLDWRDIRADLVARRHELLEPADSPEGTASHKTPSQKLGPKWAHSIPFPEPACVLVSTESLDGIRSFERTVILLLRLGTRDPRYGASGIIINRPLHKKIKHMNPSNANLATTFAECSLHFGGPLDTNIFLIKTGDSSAIPGFEQIAYEDNKCSK